MEPYESVVELYSLPKAGSIDPDLVMAPFHFIFFGMMLSDAGYGLVLTVMLYFALKKFRPTGFARQLAMVIFFGSISTIIWGAMFGGWFGLEWQPLLFVPMKEPLKMLALCFGLGAIHLVAGMVVKIYMLLRDGDVMGAVCDQISWLIMFLGFFLMALVPGPVGKYLAWLGAGIIVLFGGREKKGIVNRLLGGLLTLYNISGYLSDLLSYSRIFALGLRQQGHRHGHQYRGPDALERRPCGHCGGHPGASGRALLQHHHQRAGCLRAQQPSAVHRILRQVLRSRRPGIPAFGAPDQVY